MKEGIALIFGTAHQRVGKRAAEVEGQPASVALFTRELDYLGRSLVRLGVASADVEDLAHEVFLVFDRRFHEYDPSRPARPWLFGIAYRVALDHLKRRRREVQLSGTLRRELPNELPAAEHTLDEKRRRDLLLRALDGLSVKLRAVLVMRDLDGADMKVVAHALNIPLFTAYSRLRLARKALRQALRELQPGDLP